MSWIDVLGVSLSVLAALLFVFLLTDWRQMDHAHARLWASGEEQDPPNALRVQIVVQGIDKK